MRRYAVSVWKGMRVPPGSASSTLVSETTFSGFDDRDSRASSNESVPENNAAIVGKQSAMTPGPESFDNGRIDCACHRA
jgi:hypothetical protein